MRTPEEDRGAAPRLVRDLAIDAYAAIIVRHLGDGYIAPRYPELCEGWVQDFKATFDNRETKPIETVFRADPMKGPNKVFDSPKEGEVSWPLFCIWRRRTQTKRFTVAVDQKRVTVEFAWVLPPHSETERIWPLLSKFDEHLWRVLRALFRVPQDKELLNAALVRDYALPWQTYETEQGFFGPGGQNLYPTLTGRWQYDVYWERTEYNHGLIHEAFNRAYFNYFIRYRKESGSMDDARLNPPLSSGVNLIPPAEGALCPPPR
jgi:hypothetical protein